MGEFSISHVLILTLILLIFFGPSRLPALGQSIGKAIKGFKEGLNETPNNIQNSSPPPSINSDAQQVAARTENPLHQKTESKTHQNDS